MKLSRALSDLVKYTQSVGLYDIEAQGKIFALMTDSKLMKWLREAVFCNEPDMNVFQDDYIVQLVHHNK